VFIVVFDTDHLSAGGFKRAQGAAAALFGKEFQTGDVGGVVSNGEMANRRLTSSREELAAAVKDAKPSDKTSSRLFDLREWPSMNDAEAFEIARKGLANDPVLDEVVRRACADDPDACRRVPPDATVYQKAMQISAEITQSSNQTLLMLAALTSGLERIEGRKTIVLLSEGFVAEQSWPIVQQTVGAAARANARIYTLDARGLDRGRQPIGNYAPHDDSLGNLLASFDMGADSINSLAVDTGGFVVRNANIFDQAIAEIAAEAGTYYVLGYRSPAKADGKFHAIAVTVKRPNVTVRARRGYIATAAPLPTITEVGEAGRTAEAGAGKPAAPEEAAKAAQAPAASPRKGAAENVAALAARDDAPNRAVASSGAAVPSAPAAAAASAAPGHPASNVASPAGDDTNADATRGWDAYRRGDLDSARAALSSAAASSTARPWVHYALGQTEYALRDFAAAVASWERVRATTPEFEPVYFDLVDGYLQSREPDKAIRVLRAAAERWPGDREVFSALGVVQVSRGAVDDAVRSFEQAIALAPDDAVGYFNLGKTLEIRYRKSRRFVLQTREWVANENDRRNAIANYEHYLKLGGPFENSAREGLERLNWAEK
jgi:VWFA-related protein